MGTDADRRHTTEHLPLASASAVVYHQLMGATPSAVSVEELNEVMGRVAHALSNVAPIHALDPVTGARVQLPPVDLLNARFERGASVLVTRLGIEYRGLSIQRSDMRSAIAILRAAQVSFAPAPPRG